MDVLMPQLGETVTEGKISKWFVSAGDAVKPGDNLFEIETDKVSMEVPAITTGTLAEIRVPAGEIAPVGAIVAVILAAGEKIASALPSASKAPAAPARSPSPAPAATTPVARPTARPAAPMEAFREVRTPERNFGPAQLSGGTTVTPLARRLAGEAGIDLASIRGSGPHGRIVARDVETTRATRPAAPTLARGASADQVKALYRNTPYEEILLNNMRATIAARLTQAQTIPHFYLSTDVEIGQLLGLREEVNASAPKVGGAPAFKLSLNDLIIKAWAAALQRVPAANAVWAEDRILRFTHSDIGVAVAIDNGLLTPVIRQAERKSLTTISAEMRDLAERARARQLKPEEYRGGASTISNLGMHGINAFSAIINPPQATILAVGAARRTPVEAADGSVKFVSMMTVTLSCDHRVVDGALGAELLAAFKACAQQPVTILA